MELKNIYFNFIMLIIFSFYFVVIFILIIIISISQDKVDAYYNAYCLMQEMLKSSKYQVYSCNH